MEEVIVANPGVSLDRLRKCFNSTYRVSLSQPRFRRWFRACGFTATRQIIINRPNDIDSATEQDVFNAINRLKAVRRNQEDQFVLPPRVESTTSEDFKPTIPPPMEDLPELGGGPPEPNVLPGGVPIPVSLYK